MNIYEFTCNNKVHKFIATGLKNAEEKGALILEDYDDNLDLLELSWKQIQNECAKYNLKVSDLIEDYE